MPIDPRELPVTHNPERNRFELQIQTLTAVLDYTIQGKIIIFTHTGVPPALEGQGIGSRITRAGLDYARQNGLKVVPLCSFVDVYIKRHPEYQDLLK